MGIVTRTIAARAGEMRSIITREPITVVKLVMMATMSVWMEAETTSTS